MAEPEDDAAAAVQRLRVALDRIAAMAHPGSSADNDPVRAEIAARLDALIAELRAALGIAADPETSRNR